MSPSVPAWIRRPRLVAIAEFADVGRADAAWALLQDADIPASVVTDNGALGDPLVSRLFVEKPEVEAAQAALAEFMHQRE